MSLEVRFSLVAAARLGELKPKNPDTAAGKLYRTIKELIGKVIADETLAFLPKHRLSGNLAGILRLKTSRYRIFFIASNEKKAAIVLYLGFRRDGDRRDAYSEFERLLKRADFDILFSELGLAKPKL